MVKEHRKNIYPENIKNFTDAVLKESQDQNFAKKFGLPGISDNVIKMFLYDMIIGGTDTILTSIRWFIVYMLYWSNIQDKIYEEIFNVVGKHRHLEFKDRESLPLLQACIYEAMRLSDIPGLGGPRKSTVNISIGGYIIPKITMIISNFWSYHRSEKYWQNPDVFDPYR